MFLPWTTRRLKSLPINRRMGKKIEILADIVRGLGTTSKWFCCSIQIEMRDSCVYLNTINTSKLKNALQYT